MSPMDVPPQPAGRMPGERQHSPAESRCKLQHLAEKLPMNQALAIDLTVFNTQTPTALRRLATTR
ncbi:hypothetical protein [Roseateles sp.]|uniref:hypothetical protein n=1 Tax=Roseateles sp. TaxID=1971397 RepID=UPI0032638C7A